MIKFDSVDFLYNTPVGRALLKVLVRKNVSRIGGKILNSSPSKVAVPYFIRTVFAVFNHWNMFNVRNAVPFSANQFLMPFNSAFHFHYLL